MALNLNIPTLQDDFTFPAEINPKNISQSLDALGIANPHEIATQICSELENLNHQNFAPSDRLLALDCYRTHIESTARQLSAEYANSTLPLNDHAKLAASDAESLWLQLGYGYKLTLIDLQNQLIKLGTDKISTRTIQRAMHAITEHARVYYQTYSTPPDSTWSDLHQLYFCAVQLGIQHLDSKDLPTVENTYKHALLMSLAETHHLTSGDIPLIAEYLNHHVALAKITAVIPLERDTGAFVIKLDSNQPPVPFIRNSEPDPATDIILHTLDMMRAIHSDLTQLKNNQLPKNNSIPSYANKDNYIDLLTHLIKNWGTPPKRVFTRLPKNDDVFLIVGITTFHQVTNEALRTSTSQHSPKTTNTPFSSGINFSASRWKVLNISATGTLLRRHHTAEKNIRVGYLIGTKAKNEQQWSVGIVRWANCGTRDRLDIGVQYLAPYADCAIANINERNRDELVLMIAEIPAVKISASIIAPKGTYAPARQLTLTYQGKIQQVMLTRLIERTHHIERIQYSIIS